MHICCHRMTWLTNFSESLAPNWIPLICCTNYSEHTIEQTWEMNCSCNCVACRCQPETACVFILPHEVLDQYGIQVPLYVISLFDAWAETLPNLRVSEISHMKSVGFQVFLSAVCGCEYWPSKLCTSACVMHMVCVLVFVQCGRGWSGRSIGNKWIQINMKPGSEGERRDWKWVSGVMRHWGGGGGGGLVLVGWRDDVLPEAQRLTAHLGKTTHFYSPNLSALRSLTVKMDA